MRSIYLFLFSWFPSFHSFLFNCVFFLLLLLLWIFFFAQINPSNSSSDNEEEEEEQELKIRVLTCKMWCINGEKSFRMSHFFFVQVRKHQIVSVLSTLKAKGQKMYVRDARTHTLTHSTTKIGSPCKNHLIIIFALELRSKDVCMGADFETFNYPANGNHPLVSTNATICKQWSSKTLPSSTSSVSNDSIACILYTRRAIMLVSERASQASEWGKASVSERSRTLL